MWRRYSPIDLFISTNTARPKEPFDGMWTELSHIRTKKDVLELAKSYDIPVYEGNALKVIEFLAKMYEKNFPHIRSRNIVKRTGHYDLGGHAWLIGQTAIGSSDMIVDSKDQHKIQAALHTKGSYEDWIHWSQAIITEHPIARWFLACAFASPILRLINCRIFVVHHYGATRLGKTALASLGQSVWGRPADQVWNWNATDISMNEVFRHVSDVSICFNELQASRLEGRPLANVVYAWCEGTPRERTKVTGGLMHAGDSWYCLIRTTGEQSLISRAGDVGGLASRVLEIPDLGVPEELSKNVIYPFLDKSYGHAGIHFLQTLSGLLNPDPETGKHRVYPNPKTGQHRTFAIALSESYDELKASLRERNVDDPFIDRLAAVALAERLMLRWIYGMTSDTADRIAIDDALLVYNAMSGRMSSTAPLWERVLHALLEHRGSAPQLYCDLDTMDGLSKARKGPAGQGEFVAFIKTNREGIREVWYNPSKATALVSQMLGVNLGEERTWGDLRAANILRAGDKRLKAQRSCADAGLKANSYYFVCDESKMIPPAKAILLDLQTDSFDWSAFDTGGRDMPEE